MKQLYLLILSFFPSFLFGQISGTVRDKKSNELLIGAKVISSNASHSLSDYNGKYQIKSKETDFPVQLIVSMLGYETDTFLIQKSGTFDLLLANPIRKIETVVVTASRSGKTIEEVAISMDVLTPKLIEHKGFRDLENAISQTPGVTAMDGQVSIRGGSGYSYGAGSRVLLLWNGMPMLSGDAGDAKFNSIPMEAASQIEVIKGASSVLYGSGALNGIISLREKLPTFKGETTVKYQVGVYDNPKRSTLKWWKTNPVFDYLTFYHGKRFKQVGYSISGSKSSDKGYRQGEEVKWGRLAGLFFYIPKKVRGLKTGLSFNAQIQRNSNFLIWQSDTFAYQPSGGAIPGDSASTLGHFRGLRMNVDPYLKFIDHFGNKHSLKTRLYFVQNKNIYNAGQTSNSLISYADYQFNRKFKFGMNITTGLTYVRTDVEANLYGGHNSNNAAFYLQLEQNFWKKLDLTFGVRAEYYEQDGKQGDSYYYFRDSSSKIPVYPVFRAALHYEPIRGTHIRASYGQGIRYPTVAERFVKTSVGSLNIFPNNNLTPEKGWAAEIGIKQVIPIGKNWKGLFDVAGFVNHYENMMEFQFGFFKPDSIPLSANPSDPGYYSKWVGFRMANTEAAQITGVETSFSSTGTIGRVELTALIGYTYMRPISLNSDSLYVLTLSSYEESEDGTSYTYDNTLKYRFNHLFRGDIEATWKGVSLGFSARYNSKMINIDRVFEESLAGTYILPGLKQYRKDHNHGALVFDARIGYEFSDKYRISFITNNLLNAEYSTRPGDIQAPRNFILQFQASF